MKRNFIYFIIAGTFGITACTDYLDVNTNANQPTEVSPNLILPQALTTTARVLNQYNTYGAQIGGYMANAGGYGGFNELVSYAYTPNNYANLWPAAYDNMEDYQFIINNTKDDELNIHFYAVAKIMRVHGFQLLADAYGDIPYSQALQGSDFLTPAYDDGATIYASLAEELDDAMAAINTGNSLAVINRIDNYDVVFGGDMDSWVKLANTIKLRLMVRGAGKVTFTDTSFDILGFLTEDALIDPGWARDNSRQNPAWNSWGFAYTGSSGNKAWLPTAFILGFYDGTKFDDPGRGDAIFYQFPSTGTNQLGYESYNIPACPNGSNWYPGTDRNGTSAGNSTGPLKGPDAGYPLFTTAETYFLQAEAVLKSITMPGALTAQQYFDAGIEASFRYLYMLPSGSFAGDYAGDAAAYIANNVDRLVQFGLNLNDTQRMEAIITQKYIALNMVHSHEGWNEFRRTGFPVVSGTSGTTTFASTASQATRSDKLPTRILYPTSEIQYNPQNVPSGISPFSSLIFWAK